MTMKWMLLLSLFGPAAFAVDPASDDRSEGAVVQMDQCTSPGKCYGQNTIYPDINAAPKVIKADYETMMNGKAGQKGPAGTTPACPEGQQCI